MATEQLETIKDAAAPTIFVDGILNLANGPEVVKFYLARVDPEVLNLHRQRSVIVGQIVMPIGAFLNTAAFLESAVKGLIASGVTSEDAWNQAKRIHEKK